MTATTTPPGLLVTLEGPEGSGKTTCSAALAAHLRSMEYPVTLTREPGGCELGLAIRTLVCESTTSITPLAELFLFEAARAQHVAQVIKPALAAGHIVLCDRFIDSTWAYQGTRGLDNQLLFQLNAIATDGLVPSLVLWLDVPPEIGLARRSAAGGGNRFEQEALTFHRTVRQRFAALHDMNRHLMRRIDGTLSSETVVNHALDLVLEDLRQRSWPMPLTS